MLALSMTQHVGIALLSIGLLVLIFGAFIGFYSGIHLAGLKIHNSNFAKGYLQADALFKDFHAVDTDGGYSYYPIVSFLNKYTGQEMTKVLYELSTSPGSFSLKKGTDTIHVQYTPNDVRLYDTRFQDFSKGDPYNSQPAGKTFAVCLVLIVVGAVVAFVGVICCAVLDR